MDDTERLTSYLNDLSTNRQKRVESLIDFISTRFPEADLSMKYKMPTFSTQNGWIALASQKHYVSVYTCSESHIASYRSRHPQIKSGKGCLNFKDRDVIDFEDLKAVVSSALNR